MQVLIDSPFVKNKRPETCELRGSVRSDLVADRMLHEGVRGDDEVAREPASGVQGEGREPVPDAPHPRLTPDQDGEEARLQEEGEQPLHPERVPDDVAREARADMEAYRRHHSRASQLEEDRGG